MSSRLAAAIVRRWRMQEAEMASTRRWGRVGSCMTVVEDSLESAARVWGCPPLEGVADVELLGCPSRDCS